MPRKRTPARHVPAPDPPSHLDELLRQADEERRQQDLETQQRADRAHQDAQARARRESVRDGLERAFELAGQLAVNLGNDHLTEELADQLLAVGQELVEQKLETILDGLPASGTAEVAWLLPLRFATSLLKMACSGDRSRVLAALDRLEAYPNLRAYYQWFGGLADRLVGPASLPGVPARLQAALPLPADGSSAARMLAEHALGLREKSPPVVAPAAEEMPQVLTTRQYTHLEAMHDLKAFSVESRQTIAQIVHRSEGRGVSIEAHKDPISDLRKRGLIATRTGRDGSCWLTAAGRACIERFLAQRDQ